jgi:anoctamin-10
MKGAEAADFDDECLVDKSAFKICAPWDLPISSIRDYYGEKVFSHFG